MLPALGTQARNNLQAEAAAIGVRALENGDDSIPTALYNVYEAFRMRFIEERNLMDSAPGGSNAWREALTDARVLEHHVNTVWHAAIVSATSNETV